MKTAFFDIDTQIDFLFPAGSLYVPGAERLIPTLSRLNHYAAAHGTVAGYLPSESDLTIPAFHRHPR